MTIGDAEDQRRISLVLDALSLARNLAHKCRLDVDRLECFGMDRKEDVGTKDCEAAIILARLQRTPGVTRKAWRRYSRRADVVDGLEQV